MAFRTKKRKCDELILPAPKRTKRNEIKKYTADCLQSFLIRDLIAIIQSYADTVQFEEIRTIGHNGKEDGQLTYPSNICFNDTELFVADRWNDRIQVFDQTTGRFLRKSKIRTNHPASLVIENGNLFVALRDYQEICTLDPIDLHFIRTIYIEDGMSLYCMCLTKDAFYIADRVLGSIVVASRTDGKSIKTIGKQEKIVCPYYCSIDGQEILVCHESSNSAHGELQSVNISTRALIRTYTFPQAMTCGPTAAIFHGDQVISCGNDRFSNLFLFDREEGNILLHANVDDQGPPCGPRFVGLAINVENELFVCDINNDRIVVFQ
jgi:hypothetical protein